MDLRLAKLKASSFYFLHNVPTLNQYRNLSCVSVVCKHFASYQYYPNYKWDFLIPSAVVYKQIRAIPLLSLRAFVACKKGKTHQKLDLIR
jgi:hypothetical protein